MQNITMRFGSRLRCFLLAACFIALIVIPGFALAAPFVYVCNRDSNTISVVDSLTKATIATIPTGNGPYAIAFKPNGTRGYVSNFFGNSVTVVDLTSNTVITTITGFGNNPGK